MNDQTGRKLSRSEWERIAKIDDIFHRLYDEWDAGCRERSSTGENMVRENMETQAFIEFKRDMYNRAIKLSAFKK